MSAKKPTGGKVFDDLMGKLVQVGKKDADRAHRAWKKKRAAKKKNRPSDSGG